MVKIVTPEEAKRAREEALQPRLIALLEKLNKRAIDSAGRTFVFMPADTELELFDAAQRQFMASGWSVSSKYEEYQRDGHTIWTFSPRPKVSYSDQRDATSIYYDR